MNRTVVPRTIIACLLAIGSVTAVVATQRTNGLYRDPFLASGNLPAAKAALLQKQQDAINLARLHPASKKTGSPPPATIQAPYPTGISDRHDGPFSPQEFLINNNWSGPGGELGRLIVFAGGKRLHPGMDLATEAAVRVYTMNPDPNQPTNLTEVGDFVAPGHSEFVTIVAARGELLDLRTNDGEALVFDTTAMRYS